MLKAMGIEDEKIEQIIEAHTETTDALKQQRDEYKAGADKAETLQNELAELKAKQPDGYEDRYKAEHDAFEKFKAEVAEKDAKAEKARLYEKLLVDSGIDPKRVGSITKLTDLDEVSVEDGKITNAEELGEKAKAEWADFVVVKGEEGAKTATPPTNGGSAMSKADIYRKDDKGRYVLSTAERQRAIAENHEQFGL